MPIDLKLVEAFHLIVRSGSLTQAESQSGQSKATLSRALSKLEQQLGAQLLSRTTRKLQLTETVSLGGCRLTTLPWPDGVSTLSPGAG